MTEGIFEGYRVHLRHPEHQCLIFPLFYESVDGSTRMNDPIQDWQLGFVRLHYNEGEEHIIPVHNIDWIERLSIQTS